MSEQKSKIQSIIKILPSMLIRAFVVLMLIVSFIIAANKVIEYNKIKAETELLAAQRNALAAEVEEINYYLNAEVDDKYKEAMARELDFYYPDEIIYIVE